MQRLIVEDAVDVEASEICYQALTIPCRGQHHVKHMVRLLAFVRNEWQAHTRFTRPAGEVLIVVSPQTAAPRLNPLPVLELRPQECREDIGREEAGAGVDPGVLIHEPAIEAAAI